MRAISMGCVLLMAALSSQADDPWPEEATGQRLEADVRYLAEEIGVRSIRHPEARESTRRYLEAQFRAAGLVTKRVPYTADGVSGVNLEASLPGTELPEEHVIVGAHYDTVEGSPGADDNASGVAVLLELARRLKGQPLKRSVHLIAFDLEEPPAYRTPAMGSWAVAQACRERGDNVVFMMALDGLGFYDDKPHSQRYPVDLPDRPDAGNFLAFLGLAESPKQLGRAAEVFKANTTLPAEMLAATDDVLGVGWSDHWSFWQAGYPHAFLVTDTLPLRNKHYHLASDRPDKLDYDRLAQAVVGLEAVVSDAANTAEDE